MKVLKYSICAVLLISQLSVFAKLDTEVTQTISKNYKVSKETQLSIRNQFGRIHIENWDKAEFSIEIELIGRGSNEERAQRVLDRIRIKISESSESYSFETELENMNNRDSEGFEVNYTVKMPKANPIRIKNSFGDVYLPDRDGTADIDVSYGSLKAQDFTARLDLEVAFGKATIGSIREAEATIKYSDVEIESADKLELDQQFSDVELERVNLLDLESKYGDVEIGDAGEIIADVEFSGFSIDRLSKSIDMDGGYVSGFEIDQLSPDFEFVYISGEFGSYEIGIAPGTNANFEGRFKFCDLKSSRVDIEFDYRVKESNESEYRGKIGNGDPNKKIRVTSRYGNLMLRE